MHGKVYSYGVKDLFAIAEGPARAAEDVPVCFCEIYAGCWAFLVCGSFGFVHNVSTSWKMAVGKFEDEDLGAVLQSVKKGLAWNLEIALKHKSISS